MNAPNMARTWAIANCRLPKWYDTRPLQHSMSDVMRQVSSGESDASHNLLQTQQERGEATGHQTGWYWLAPGHRARNNDVFHNPARSRV